MLTPKLMLLTKLIWAVLLIGLISSCSLSGKEEENMAQKATIEYEETDPLLQSYSDSLQKYFGLLEIDLIRQYKNNHENLDDAREFYDFYRNANTLRNTLTKTMNKHAEYALENGGTPVSFSWFEDVAKGFKVKLDREKGSFEVNFDYDDLEEHAQQTSGKMDDDFVKLLEIAYDTAKNQYCWIEKAPNGIYCSSLGSNDHYKILEQAALVLENDEMFTKEVKKIQVAVLNDILFRKSFWHDKDKVIEEIEQILEDIAFKKNEPQLLQVRLQKLKEGKDEKIQFGCQDGSCKAPPQT